MKKLKFLGLVAMVAGLFSLTSCLNGGGNTASFSSCGYAKFSTAGRVVVTSDKFTPDYASPSFDSQLIGGEYVSFFAQVDYDAQTSDKYTLVTASNLEKYPEYPLRTVVGDTTTLLSNEMAIDGIALVLAGNDGSSQYAFTANKHVFLGAMHKDAPSDMKVQYEFSYDPSAGPITVNSQNVYELYIRAIKTDAGSNTKSNRTIYGAYDVTYFLNSTLNKEKAAGNKTVNVRFKYFNKIDSEKNTGELKGESDIYSFIISQYIDEK